MDVGGVVHGQHVVLDVAEHGGTTVVGLQAEQAAQMGIELDNADRGVAQVAGAVQPGRQLIFEQAQQAALAGAGLAGDGTDAAGVDQQLGGGQVALHRRE